MRPFRVISGIALMLLAPVGVSAQATFDAATVKPARTVTDIVPGEFRVNGQWVGQAATLSMLVRSAYDLPAERIIGLPSWAMSERYDVVTTSEPGRSSELRPERKHAALHRNRRPPRRVVRGVCQWQGETASGTGGWGRARTGVVTVPSAWTVIPPNLRMRCFFQSTSDKEAKK